MGSAFPLHEAEVRAEGRAGCSGLGAWGHIPAGCSGLGAWGTRSCWVQAVGSQRKRCREVWGLPVPPFPQCESFQANILTPSWQVTDLHQELAEARRAVTELESEREQKQRDFDRKLLLAKSRIETEEVSPLGRVTGSCQPCCPALADLPPPWVLQAEKERLAMEVRDLQQRMRFLQEQLAPVTRQREYQEKEIQRLNKVGTRAQLLTAKCL